MPEVISTLPIGSYETAQSCPLGTRTWNWTRSYIYVKFVDAVTYVVGHVCTPTATAFNVTNDRSGGTATDERCAGAIPNVDNAGNTITTVPTQNQYGWLQIGGPHSALVTDGGDDIAAFDTLIVDPTVDGAVDSVAAATDTGTLLLVGIASADDVDASDRVACFGIKSIIW